MAERLSGRIAREWRFYSGLARLLHRVRSARPDSDETLADLVERQARRAPARPAIRFEGRIVTYGEWDEAASRVAHWALTQGIGRGEVVALLMENRPEFLFVWAGLAKIGAVTALLTAAQTGRALAGSLDLANAGHLVLGAELGAAYESAAAFLARPLRVWTLGGEAAGGEALEPMLAGGAAPVGRQARPGLKGRDRCFLVYTSGTTGQPKAALISHTRVFLMMHAFAALMRTAPRSRMLVTLPLYHTSGGVCAVGAALTVGGQIILKRKFSAQTFWDDCVSEQATHFIYIGELCRYLLSAPPHPLERAHRLEAIVGNGLRAEVWAPFKERFGIPRIVEFYSATEGNVTLFNFDGREGAVGRIPSLLKRAFHMRLVAYDPVAGEIVRGQGGFARECRPGEVGEAIGRISEHVTRARFEGYTGVADTQKKILTDVFEPGDRWYRSGDLLRRDEAGYFTFVDRIGDTFRWKGENVATTEVSEALSRVPGVLEASVYGVEVPGTEGRAGMAALSLAGELDLDLLADRLVAALAPYARPVFLRVAPALETTPTFKHKKTNLARQGFDPSASQDPLYFKDPAGRYQPLTPEAYRAIAAGRIRL